MILLVACFGFRRLLLAFEQVCVGFEGDMLCGCAVMWSVWRIRGLRCINSGLDGWDELIGWSYATSLRE